MSNLDGKNVRGGFMSRVWGATKAPRERRALRMAAPYLLDMTDEQLKNIGYSREEIRAVL
jgi:uncharacterized protein YjiS (DUF1127 family)